VGTELKERKQGWGREGKEETETIKLSKDQHFL
jgi:hypothetical protein